MKKKVIVSALSLAIGAGLAGSITGTAAWYQYSTKTQAALVGVAGGVKGNLQMRIRNGQAQDEGWVTRITKEDMATFLGTKKIVPLTSGAMERNDAIPGDFYCNPLYGYEAQTSWKKAVAANYISIPLEFRYVETNDQSSENLAKDIYLSDLFIAQDASDELNHEDISSAIRFHISAYSDPSAKTNRLVSKNGGETATHGNLDLNGDGEDDRKYDNKSDKYGFTDGEGQLIDYGVADSKQVSYAAAVNSATAYSILADIPNNVLEGRKLGTTLTADDQFLQMDITIWVEGWQKLPEGSSGKAIWDVEDFVNAKFDIGFEFETPHND